MNNIIPMVEIMRQLFAAALLVMAGPPSDSIAETDAIKKTIQSTLHRINVPEATAATINEQVSIHIAKGLAHQVSAQSFGIDWAKEKAAQRRRTIEFESAIEARLQDSDTRAWLACRRAMQRQRVVPELAALRIHTVELDLFHLIEELELNQSDSKDLLPILADYEMQLKERLDRWEATADQLLVRFYEIDASRHATIPNAESELQSIRMDIHRLVATVDELNVKYAAVMASPLIDLNKEQFLTLVHAPSQTSAYDSSPVDVAVAAIAQDADVKASIKEAVDALYQPYKLHRAALRDRYTRATAMWNNPRDVEKRAQRKQELINAGGSLDVIYQGNPVIAHVRALHRLEEETCRQIRSMLGDTDLDKLPLEARVLLTLW